MSRVWVAGFLALLAGGCGVLTGDSSSGRGIIVEGQVEGSGGGVEGSKIEIATYLREGDTCLPIPFKRKTTRTDSGGFFSTPAEAPGDSDPGCVDVIAHFPGREELTHSFLGLPVTYVEPPSGIRSGC